jgi:hypothetical protein
LINSAAVSGEGAGNGQQPCRLTFPYHVFEAALLVWVKELRLDEPEPGQGGGVAEDRLATLLDRQTDINININAIQRRVTNPEKGVKVDTLLDSLMKLERDRDDLQAQIDEQTLKATGHNDELLKNVKSMIDQLDATEAKGDPSDIADIRDRIRGRIRAMVDRIYVLLFAHVSKVDNRVHRWARIQIHLRGGHVRHIVVRDDGQAGGSVVNDEMAANRDLRSFRESGQAEFYPASPKAARDAAAKDRSQDTPARGQGRNGRPKGRS